MASFFFKTVTNSGKRGKVPASNFKQLDKRKQKGTTCFEISIAERKDPLPEFGYFPKDNALV